MSFVSALKLHSFRCYDYLDLAQLSPGLVVLHGPNGAGKTNILEALSFLVPGRGLRAAKSADVQKQGSAQNWALSACVENTYGTVQIGTGRDPRGGKRVIRINGENAKGQSALADHLACVWLTPQMDRFFLDSSRERRKFLDRLVFAFDPGHSGRTLRYENAMRQRAKILSGDVTGDPAWLDSLEAQMAETGVAIAAARLEFVERLQAACDKGGSVHFPQADLRTKGTLESLLEEAPALEIEELFKRQLLESRGVDQLTGGAATGPHKSDLCVRYTAKNMPAPQCSTGEQKALLIGIVLSHARLIAAERGTPPLLLLDEVAAHLDENRRAALYEFLNGLGGQVWLTGTDAGLFDAVRGTAQFFEVREAHVAQTHQMAVFG